MSGKGDKRRPPQIKENLAGLRWKRAIIIERLALAGESVASVTTLTHHLNYCLTYWGYYEIPKRLISRIHKI